MCILLSLPLSPTSLTLTLLLLSFFFETLFPLSQPHPSLLSSSAILSWVVFSLWFVWSALHIPILFSSRPNTFHTVREYLINELCFAALTIVLITATLNIKRYECVSGHLKLTIVWNCVYKTNVCLCNLEYMIVFISVSKLPWPRIPIGKKALAYTSVIHIFTYLLVMYYRSSITFLLHINGLPCKPLWGACSPLWRSQLYIMQVTMLHEICWFCHI